jgi:hypothetical protein
LVANTLNTLLGGLVDLLVGERDLNRLRSTQLNLALSGLRIKLHVPVQLKDAVADLLTMVPLVHLSTHPEYLIAYLYVLTDTRQDLFVHLFLDVEGCKCHVAVLFRVPECFHILVFNIRKLLPQNAKSLLFLAPELHVKF